MAPVAQTRQDHRLHWPKNSLSLLTSWLNGMFRKQMDANHRNTQCQVIKKPADRRVF
jgi:hypothetical protein